MASWLTHPELQKPRETTGLDLKIGNSKCHSQKSVTNVPGTATFPGSKICNFSLCTTMVHKADCHIPTGPVERLLGKLDQLIGIFV